MGHYADTAETPCGSSIVTIRTSVGIWGYTRVDVSTTGAEFDTFHIFAATSDEIRAQVCPVIDALDEYPTVQQALRRCLGWVAP